MTIRQFKFQLWLDHLSPNVLKRSFVLALIIGSLLTLVNQFSALFGGQALEKLPLVLAFVTPFLVITLSQLGATQQALIDSRQTQPQGSNRTLGFFNIMLAHNIPQRALLIAVVAGSINGVIIIMNMPLQAEAAVEAAWPLLAQPYVLPFIFGAFSQTMTYRRRLSV